MATLVVYGLIALAVLSAIGGTVWKIDNNGFQRGEAQTTQKYEELAAKSKAAAEADRQRQDALRASQDAKTTRRLTDERKRATALSKKLDEALAKHAELASLPLPDSLRDAWNAANAGPEGERAGAVPSASGKPADPH